MSTTRKRIKEIEAMVSHVVPETEDSATLVLFTGNDLLDYAPGHFLTISPHQFPGLQRWVRYLEHTKGKKEPPRAYSLSSSPDEKHLAITVKEEQYVPGITPYPPLLSPILAKRTPPGTKMVITGFTGPYTLRESIRAAHEHIVHVCAGSGIVPSYSIIKHDLRTRGDRRHTLVYSNKTLDDVIFRRQLEDLERRFPDRLRVLHTLTREPGAPAGNGSVRLGRVSRALLEEVITEPAGTAVFVCGPDHSHWQRKAAKARGLSLPPSFLGSVLDYLRVIGVRDDSITTESYG